MRIPQLSLTIANKPGHLSAPCKVLAEAGVSLVTLSLADQKEVGILRLIVQDWQHARKLLEDAGFQVEVTEVLALEVRDRPGGLVELLQVFEKGSINVEYMYAFSARLGDSAVMVFSFSDLDAAIFALARAGINPVSRVTLYESLEDE